VGAPGFLWVQKQALPGASCRAAGGAVPCSALCLLWWDGDGDGDSAPAEPWPCPQCQRSAAQPSSAARAGSAWPWPCAVMVTATAQMAQMRRAVPCPGRGSAARARWRVLAAGSACQRLGSAMAMPTAGTARMSRWVGWRGHSLALLAAGSAGGLVHLCSCRAVPRRNSHVGTSSGAAPVATSASLVSGAVMERVTARTAATRLAVSSTLLLSPPRLTQGWLVGAQHRWWQGMCLCRGKGRCVLVVSSSICAGSRPQAGALSL